MASEKMSVELFQEYAELKVKEKEIKSRIDELKNRVIEEMNANDIDKQPTDLGTFTIQLTKKWKFTDAVKKAEDYVVDLKEGEKATGLATYSEVQELKFFHIKSSE